MVDPNQDGLVTVAPQGVRRRIPRVGGIGRRSGGWFRSCDASNREDLMALKLEDKKVVVAEVNAVAAKALSVVGAENRGLTVTQMTDLRAKARKEGVYLRIVKNTLARKAVAGTSFECISPALKDLLSRILQRRSRRGGAHRQGVREGQRQVGDDAGVLGGQLLKAQDIDRVASLPTRAQAVSKLLGSYRRRFRSSLERWRLPTPSW